MHVHYREGRARGNDVRGASGLLSRAQRLDASLAGCRGVTECEGNLSIDPSQDPDARGIPRCRQCVAATQNVSARSGSVADPIQQRGDVELGPADRR